MRRITGATHCNENIEIADYSLNQRNITPHAPYVPRKSNGFHCSLSSWTTNVSSWRPKSSNEMRWDESIEFHFLRFRFQSNPIVCAKTVVICMLSVDWLLRFTVRWIEPVDKYRLLIFNRIYWLHPIVMRSTYIWHSSFVPLTNLSFYWNKLKSPSKRTSMSLPFRRRQRRLKNDCGQMSGVHFVLHFFVRFFYFILQLANADEFNERQCVLRVLVLLVSCSVRERKRYTHE